MERNDRFGPWLRQRRKALDLTQTDLAHQIGCSIITLRKIEADERRPSKQFAERLADVLAISPEERAEFVAFARRTEVSPPLVSVRSDASTQTHNLPPQPTPFIGRTAELTHIAKRLNYPDCRLLTLVGPGGIGKTRLALEAARDQQANFANGVYFVALAPVAAPNLVAPAMAGALKLTFYDPADPILSLVYYLREKAILLLLDNFEHLLEATRLLTDILAAAPQVKILVTSREALNLQEEWVWRVEGLSFPASAEIENLEDYSAVELFVECAQKVRANFSLVDEREGVIRICRLVQGMPLAIELAAAWLKTLPCARIADEIQRNLNFLASPLRNVPARHRSMRAVFDHSWKLLTSEEQAVFRTLSVFRGGFEHEAAEQIATASLQTLMVLVDKSLLQCTAAGRYDLHELLRQYAEQQLESAGESTSARAAHSAYYMDFLAQQDADVKGPRQTAALQEISIDFENIRTAWQWTQDHHEYGAISQAVNCLINFAEMRGSLPDALGILEQTGAALAPASGELPHPVWEQVVVRCEWINAHLFGKVDHVLVETILQHVRERHDQQEIAWCLWVLTDHAYLSDDRERMVTIAEESLAMRRALGDEFYIAHTLSALAIASEQDGQTNLAFKCALENVAIRRRLGGIHSLGWSLSGLGGLQVRNSSLTEAETTLDQGIGLQETYGKSPVYVFLMANKAALAFWRGEFETATRLVAAGLNIAQDQDYQGMRSYSLAVLSYVQSMAGSYAQGWELCQQTSARAIHPYNMKVGIEWGTALASCGLGDDKAADKGIQAVLSSIHSLTWQWLCLPLAAIQAARKGKTRRAVELLGLTSTAPRNLMGWLERWPLMIDLKADLHTELGAEAYESAWEHGKTLALDTVIADLLGNPKLTQAADRL